jgi:hypothetical protein
MSRHNPKKENENQQSMKKNPMQIWPKAMKCWSMITKKNQDEKIVVCHKSASDKNALAMMCGRDEEPWPSTTAHWRIDVACTWCKAMDTHCR